MKRDDLLKSLLPKYFKPGCSWLDVGAGDGTVSLELNKLLKPRDFRCIDIQPGKRKPFHPTVHPFNGTGPGLAFICSKQEYDFILFNFVLHHAAENMWPLLQTASMFTSCIVIQEDLQEEWPNHRPGKSVKQLLTEHDPKAIYHSFSEWEKLLRENIKVTNLAIDSVRHPDIPVEDTFGYHVPRGIFILHGKTK
jgi:hypothetical protein